LARSASELFSIISELGSKDVGFRVLDDGAVDTTTRTGKLLFGILAVIAEFETEIRRERQMEGIARAKAAGRSGGRPRTVTDSHHEEIRSRGAKGESVRRIGAALGISKSTVQKVLAAP